MFVIALDTSSLSSPSSAVVAVVEAASVALDCCARVDGVVVVAGFVVVGAGFVGYGPICAVQITPPLQLILPTPIRVPPSLWTTMQWFSTAGGSVAVVLDDCKST